MTFLPAAHLQIAVWIEDAAGNYVDTAYVTRSTGALGLANRPGNARFKSAYRWPYGRREMVLPVWAHTRGKQYPLRGHGRLDGHRSARRHHRLSRGLFVDGELLLPAIEHPARRGLVRVAVHRLQGHLLAGQYLVLSAARRPDARSAASTPTDARDFATQNDLSAISSATPPGGQILDPDVRWAVPSSLPNGQYVVKVEASLEGDFNASNTHPSLPDANQELRGFGRDVLGQPSIVYAVPITIDGIGADRHHRQRASATATGTARPARCTAMDGSLNDMPGSGIGRLDHVTDADGTWRVKVFANGCQGCRMSAPPTNLTADPSDTTIGLSFNAPAYSDALDQPKRYEIRYQAKMPFDDAGFGNATPADKPPAPGTPGQAQTATVNGLKAETLYYVGIRALNACGQPSTAAFTSGADVEAEVRGAARLLHRHRRVRLAMARELDSLRALRDGALLTNPLGRLAVAVYYAMSPPLARAIASDERLRAGARAILQPAVALARAWLLSQHRAR